MEDYQFNKLEDLARGALAGRPGVSDFMNPGEQRKTAALLQSGGFSRFRFAGGYDDAERVRAFLFPDYFSREDEDEWIASSIAALRITGSGYEKLKHADFMGAVLALGLRRGKIGDILVPKEAEAVVFYDSLLTGFFFSGECPLTAVGRDKVKLAPFAVGPDFDSGRRYQPVNETVASPRLDCTAAAVTGLSREKVKTMILSGQVSLNYDSECSCDDEVEAGDILSVRGGGKFRITEIENRTRKGRIRLCAQKYI